jgi:hypothetical protein
LERHGPVDFWPPVQVNIEISWDETWIFHQILFTVPLNPNVFLTNEVGGLEIYLQFGRTLQTE